MKLVVTTVVLRDDGDDMKSLWTVVGGETHVVGHLLATEVIHLSPPLLDYFAELHAIQKGVIYEEEDEKAILVDWSLVEDQEVADGEQLVKEWFKPQENTAKHNDPFA